MRIFILIVCTQLFQSRHVRGIRVAASAWRRSPASNWADSYDISVLYAILLKVEIESEEGISDGGTL